MPIDEKYYLKAIDAVGEHLDESMKLLGERSHGWLKTAPSRTSFADLVFDVGNRVYAVLMVELKPGNPRNGHKMSCEFSVTEGDRRWLLENCEEYGLEPTYYPLWLDKMFPMVAGAWNLIDARTMKFINPAEIEDLPGKVPLSEWELQNICVRFVLVNMRKRGLEILSYQDVPGITPNAWFRDKEGKVSVLTVVRGKKGEVTPKFPDMKKVLSTMPDMQEPPREYVVYVEIENDVNPEEPILRGGLFNIQAEEEEPVD